LREKVLRKTKVRLNLRDCTVFGSCFDLSEQEKELDERLWLVPSSARKLDVVVGLLRFDVLPSSLKGRASSIH
jgi:hypothetical protein